MSSRNRNRRSPSEPTVLGTSIKNKRSILNDHSFVIDIAEAMVRIKVERLINSYGGKILQSLEKSVNFLITNRRNNKKNVHNNDLETVNCSEDVEKKNVPCSRSLNSIDLIKKANILNVQILSPKQFQHWLKTILKKQRGNKGTVDKVASVLRGKISLKIESLDQNQSPVFEFIPKWPDLGDALSKKKPKIPNVHNCIDNKSTDEYSSDQYSTSEIGGMCELCDMPFMNYKEHINTKKHLRESQDENKFHELDDLINERPLSVIFNELVPDKTMLSEEKDGDLKKTIDKSHIEDTVITIIDSDSNDNEGNVPCSFGDKNSSLEKKTIISIKRNCCSDTNIRFVPQKKPSVYRYTPSPEKMNYKKTKRKRKVRQKRSSKDIYKVEVVNSLPKSSKDNFSDNKIELDKPPVIIRLKRVQNSKCKTSSKYSDCTSPGYDDEKTQEKLNLNHRCIRVVRKPSISYSGRNGILSKGFSNDLTFMFEQPELRQYLSKKISYSPTCTYIPNTGSSMEFIKKKLVQLENCNSNSTLSFNESIKIMSNIKPQKIGDWFYKVHEKIKDDLSFDSTVLIPIPKLSNDVPYKISDKIVKSSTSCSVDIL